MKNFFKSIQTQILSLILVILGVTIVAVIYLVYTNQRSDLLSETDKIINLNNDTLHTSLKNMMLDGKAFILVKTMSELEDISQYSNLSIFRTNGKLAFSDYTTIDSVNNFQKGMTFEKTERIKDERSNEHQKYILENVKKVVASHRRLQNFLVEDKSREYFFPIVNEKQCMVCHGSDHSIRGVIHMQVSVAGIYKKIAKNRKFLIYFFLVVGVALIILLFFMLRFMIISPVIKIGNTVKVIGEGNFDARVPIKRNNEIGILADKINVMIKGLEERFKLSKYVSNSTEKLIKEGGSFNKEATKKNITVLFSDIRGFTSYSEKHSPETVISNLNQVLAAQAKIVHEKGGDIDKFVGDEIFATFTDECSAVAAGIEMINAVIQLDKKSGSTLRVGIGINTGEVVAGNIGSYKRLEYALIGDTVNLGARLCSIAPPNTLYISSSSYEKVKDKITAELINGKKIKGKSQTVNFYKVKSIKNCDKIEKK